SGKGRDRGNAHHEADRTWERRWGVLRPRAGAVPRTRPGAALRSSPEPRPRHAGPTRAVRAAHEPAGRGARGRDLRAGPLRPGPSGPGPARGPGLRRRAPVPVLRLPVLSRDAGRARARAALPSARLRPRLDGAHGLALRGTARDGALAAPE